MSGILTRLKKIYTNLRGFHTDRKIVVIESDDWGSIRMPSRATLEHLLALGDNASDDAFLSCDCLESESDLVLLYEVLRSVEDSRGNHPVITMNFAMANPNFDKIDYQNGIYEHEPFYDTYDRYYGENRVLEILKSGIAEKLILPQLHCREHLNVSRWMFDLKHGKPDTVLAYEHKTMGVGASFAKDNVFGYMDAFNTDRSSDDELEKILEDAFTGFSRVFGYESASFVASCYVWSDGLEKALARLGVRFIQGAAWQNKAVGKDGRYKLQRRLRFAGEKNRLGQIYGVRNCSFEPAYNQNPEESAVQCLGEITEAFAAHKPAVICSHRFNYIGSINPRNREGNLSGLKSLLESIVAKYPDVEFMSSEELFSIMAQEKK